jgi:hypothetical protein
VLTHSCLGIVLFIELSALATKMTGGVLGDKEVALALALALALSPPFSEVVETRTVCDR